MAAPPPALVSRLRANLKMAVNRLKLLEEKEMAMAKMSRRELAQLMENGKVSSAKIRVEIVIRQDIYAEVLELLELQCSLALARINMLDNLDKDERLKEAVYTIIYTSVHTDIKELMTLRDLFSHIMPKEFMLDALNNESGLVPESISSRLHSGVPDAELVQSYLGEIARAYKISVPGIYEVASPETEKAETEKSPPKVPTAKKDNDDLMARFQMLRK